MRSEKTFGSGISGSGRPRTVIELTKDGRKAFYAYLDHLQTLLKAIPGRPDQGHT